MPARAKSLPCARPCTQVEKFITEQKIAAGQGLSLAAPVSIDGFRYINIFVQFSQESEEEMPVDLGVMFAFDQVGTMGARCYANLEENLSTLQETNVIEISGSGSWHGKTWKLSSYVARFPVLGPFIQVFVYNRAEVVRTVSVWAYLVC